MNYKNSYDILSLKKHLKAINSKQLDLKGYLYI